MKKCQKCGHENSDAMRFCLECGTPLADAPIIINLQDGSGSNTQKQANVDTASFGQSMQTQVGGRSNFPNNFPAVPPSAPRKNKKMFIVAGGIGALLLLVFAAGAAIVGYNIIFPPPKPIVYNPTPTPSATRTNEKTPKPTPSATPEDSPSPTPDDSPTPKNEGGEMTEFRRIWVDYNVTEKGRLGMRIHVDFSVKNMKGVASYLAIYFQKKDGAKLFSNNQNYRSKDGQVALYKSLKPGFDVAEYDDATLFMPYDELNLTRGDYELQMDVDLIYESGEMAEHMSIYDFEYKKS